MRPYARCSNCGNEEPLPTDSCTLCWHDRLEVSEAHEDACADYALTLAMTSEHDGKPAR
ncbi:hypothetical protein [Sphingobium sp. SCG-1]|uniref:hypothetical protein n=1 Tax=Sphingobium sp. SCG-1 TaxID=2072936 RepID=UPI00166F97F6|nr:hypothetical protein [Sphingobium sp. SCG-1]